MLKSLLPYHLISGPFFAIEHTVIDGQLRIAAVESKQKKHEFDIVETFSVGAISELTEFIKKGQAVSLVVTDDQILTKQIKSTGTSAEILSKAYPNLDLNNFYYEILKGETNAFIAICRKDYIESIIAEYITAGISLTGVALGNLQVAYALPYQEQSVLNTLTATVTHSEGELQEIEEQHEGAIENYTFGDVTIAEDYVLPVAMVFKKMRVEVPVSGNMNARTQELNTHYRESKFFKNTLVVGISVLLATLLINFFVFSSSYKKWQHLQEEMQVYTTQKKQLDARIVAVKNKEAIVNSVLNTGFSKSSWYIDQVIQSQPGTIILEDLEYQPLQKTIRNDKPIVLAYRTIIIIGKSTEKSDFTNWLRVLEELNFVDRITIINYGSKKGSTADFEVQLSLVANDTKK